MAPTLLQRGSMRGKPGAVPVHVITDWLRKRMPEYGGKEPAQLRDRVIIAKSETGSGKSTVLPAHVFRLLRDEKTPASQPYTGRNVLCTQPRVLTAMTLARDMAASPHYPDLFLPGATGPGARVVRGTVGFQTGPVSNKPRQGLVYATAGVLLMQLTAAAAEGDFSPISSMYAFIIIDEAHERSMDTDRVLMLIKQYLLHELKLGGAAAKRLPFIILASATINAETYARFFDITCTEGACKGLPLPSNYFHVTGRQHPIRTHWPELGTNDYRKSAVERAVEIHTKNANDPLDQRDVLIFMPGAAESNKVRQALVDLRSQSRELDVGGPVVILLINSEEVGKEKLDFALVKAPPESMWSYLESQEFYSAQTLQDMKSAGLHPRRIVVSTVVAETGLTIETLKYVIDCGWNRSQELYQPYSIGGLITRPAAQSRVLQRKGRAGRLFPGEFYPLYTENVFNALRPQQMPDIVTDDAGPLVLSMVLGQEIAKPGREFRLEDVDMLDLPPTDSLVNALDQAFALGFMSSRARLGPPETPDAKYGYGLTALGRRAVKFSRLSLPEIRVLLSAPLWDVSMSDLATIVGIVSQAGGRGLAHFLDKTPRREVLQAKDPGRTLVEVLVPAIMAGLPELFTRSIGGEPVNSEHSVRMAAAVFGDDHLLGLCIIEGFRNQLRTVIVADPSNYWTKMEEWCKARSLSFEAILDTISARESAMNQLIMAGVNPFWNEAARLFRTKSDEVVARAVAIKRCLYDAYRLKVLTSSEPGKYADRYGHAVSTALSPTMSVLASSGIEPATLITSKITLSQLVVGPTPQLKWKPTSALVSTMDGGLAAVQPDPQLTSPRA